MIGQVLNGVYELTDLVGSGGYANVYRARDLRSGATVAVKVLHSHFARMQDIAARFEREISLARRLQTPQVARILDAGRDPASPPYMVMEFVPGQTAAERVERYGPLPVVEAVEIVDQLLGALKQAHAIGIIHRDLKPHNLMLEPSGRVRVLDFGVSRIVGAGTITAEGELLGTPEYMAPEQLEGRPIDARADLYAVGAVLYHLLAGRPPYLRTPEGNIWEVVRRVRQEPPQPILQIRPDLPPSLVAVLDHAMARDPDQRFATAFQMQQALAEAAGADPPTPPPLRVPDFSRPAPPAQPTGGRRSIDGEQATVVLPVQAPATPVADDGATTARIAALPSTPALPSTQPPPAPPLPSTPAPPAQAPPTQPLPAAVPGSPSPVAPPTASTVTRAAAAPTRIMDAPPLLVAGGPSHGAATPGAPSPPVPPPPWSAQSSPPRPAPRPVSQTQVPRPGNAGSRLAVRWQLVAAGAAAVMLIGVGVVLGRTATWGGSAGASTPVATGAPPETAVPTAMQPTSAAAAPPAATSAPPVATSAPPVATSAPPAATSAPPAAATATAPRAAAVPTPTGAPIALPKPGAGTGAALPPLVKPQAPPPGGAARPGATPPPGGVIIAESFSRPEGGLLTRTSPRPSEYTFAYEQGEYVIRKVNPSLPTAPIVFVSGEYADTVIAVDVRIVGDPAARYAFLVCRDRSSGSQTRQYRASIVPEARRVILSYWDDGVQKVLGETRDHPDVRPGDSVNRLGLRCVGPKIEATVNGTTVVSVENGDLPAGEHALGAGTFTGVEGTMEARFDNLEVRRP